MEKGALRNFRKFTGKHLCQSLRSATLLTKRTPFFTEDLWTTASEFITEMLIFKSNLSQMFFKISVLKNFAILEPLSNNKPSFTEHSRWLLLNFCGNKYFIAAEYGIYC